MFLLTLASFVSLRWVTWWAVTVSPCSLSTWAIWTAPWSRWSTAGRVSWARVPWSWSSSSTSWRSSLKTEIENDLISLSFIHLHFKEPERCRNTNRKQQRRRRSSRSPMHHFFTWTISRHLPRSHGFQQSQSFGAFYFLFLLHCGNLEMLLGAKKKKTKRERDAGGLWSGWMKDGGIGAFLVLGGTLLRGLYRVCYSSFHNQWNWADLRLKMISYWKYLTLKRWSYRKPGQNRTLFPAS